MLNFDKNIFTDLQYLGCADGYIDDIVENIDDIRLLQSFSLDEIKALCHYMHCYAAPRGYILFEEGDKQEHLLVILSGAVSVSKMIESQGVKEISEAGLGATLGELSLIDGQPSFASCMTTMPTDFAVLSRGALNEILMNHPRLGNKLLLVLLEMVAFNIRDVEGRFLPLIDWTNV